MMYSVVVGGTKHNIIHGLTGLETNHIRQLVVYIWYSAIIDNIRPPYMGQAGERGSILSMVQCMFGIVSCT